MDTPRPALLPLRARIFAALSLALMIAGAAASLDPAPSAGNPFAAARLPPEARFSIEGPVEERIEAGSYVYLRVAGVWVATLGATASDAPRVRVVAMGRAHDFVSRRLGRRFDVLVFGIVRAATDAAPEEEGS